MSNEPDDETLNEARSEFTEKTLQPVSFVFACKLIQVPPNGKRGKVIFCEHDEVALFRFGTDVYAISNICPHQASPLLAEGKVDTERMTVECPMHGWTYRITDGECVTSSGRVKSYKVKVIENEVWVEEPLEAPPEVIGLEY